MRSVVGAWPAGGRLVVVYGGNRTEDKQKPLAGSCK